jgi:hypothetical protein
LIDGLNIETQTRIQNDIKKYYVDVREYLVPYFEDICSILDPTTALTRPLDQTRIDEYVEDCEYLRR